MRHADPVPVPVEPAGAAPSPAPAESGPPTYVPPAAGGGARLFRGTALRLRDRARGWRRRCPTRRRRGSGARQGLLHGPRGSAAGRLRVLGHGDQQPQAQRRLDRRPLRLRRRGRRRQGRTTCVRARLQRPRCPLRALARQEARDDQAVEARHATSATTSAPPSSAAAAAGSCSRSSAPAGSASTSRVTRTTRSSAIRPTLPFTGEIEYSCASSNRGSDSPGVGGPNTVRTSCDMTAGSSGGGWIAGRTLLSVTSYGYPTEPGVLYGPYLGRGRQEALQAGPRQAARAAER